MAGDNRRKALEEVVSLQAWHKPFSPAAKKVDLFVDVAFTTGRLGGEEASEVRFTLGLKAAEIVVMIPPTEPARIALGSVERDAPSANLKLTSSRATKKKNKAHAGVSGGISNLKAKAGASIGLSSDIEAAEETRVAIEEAVKNMRLLHMAGIDGSHRWTVASVSGEALYGRPWTSKKAPRLKVVDTRGDRATGLEPAITVEIRCRREDLVISDVELKDAKGLSGLLRRGNRANQDAAAHAVIRTRLFEEGLLGGSNEDRYAVMTLASIFAESD